MLVFMLAGVSIGLHRINNHHAIHTYWEKLGPGTDQDDDKSLSFGWTATEIIFICHIQ
jgi:hypothetical protein